MGTEGYKGETYKDQLRKFYESYAHCWYELYGVDRNYILYLVKSYNHLLCQKRFTLSQS